MMQIMKTQPHLFCFGLGYTTLRLAQKAVEEGWRVSGTCRTQEKCESMHALGITAHLFDTDLPLLEPELLRDVTHIVHSIPSGEIGDPVYALHHGDLESLAQLAWFGYLSTTGVYGDHQGEWVDEKTPPRPNNTRLEKRVEAEQHWLASALPAHIFRLSGIYGPGRNSIEQLKAGKARRIDKPGQVFNRIHVDDIVSALWASMQHPTPNEIFNVSDDEPAAQAEVVSYAAQCCGLAEPELIPYEQAELSEMGKSFYQSNRRVKNQKMKEMLGVKLRYPTYREGLVEV